VGDAEGDAGALGDAVPAGDADDAALAEPAEEEDAFALAEPEGDAEVRVPVAVGLALDDGDTVGAVPAAHATSVLLPKDAVVTHP